MSELMDKHYETFGVKRPVIGCLHMQALPGTPYADPEMTFEEQIRRLKADALQPRLRRRFTFPLAVAC